MDIILETNGICKQYKNRTVLENVNMHIFKGDIYGFVGENGAGKTTVIRIITGLVNPTEGEYSLFGVNYKDKDICKMRKNVSAIVEAPSIYKNLSLLENLKMQATILGITEERIIDEVIAEVGLGYLKNDKKLAKNFSLGMRQRLGLAMALLNNPDFIILDEPMNGLDPQGIVEIRELILHLNQQKGITFLISSHILTELQLIATKYGIISHGKLIKEISAEELTKECQKYIEVQIDQVEKFQDLALFKEIVQTNVNTFNIYDQLSVEKVVLRLHENQINILKLNYVEDSFEDFYLSLLGGKK